MITIYMICIWYLMVDTENVELCHYFHAGKCKHHPSFMNFIILLSSVIVDKLGNQQAKKCSGLYKNTKAACTGFMYRQYQLSKPPSMMDLLPLISLASLPHASGS